ncbi:GumC family protein [Massilia niabensis]|uniref:GumC family protein n=1 Tax=Massilia niabensis TaxID=544910 RepID=A0ABW0LB66_9BURK
MNDNHSSVLSKHGQHEAVGFSDLLAVFVKNKKLIFGAPLAVAVLVFGICLLLPPTYRASTLLLPPQQAQSATAALLSQLGGAAGLVAGAAGMKNPADVYIGMLKSRTVADRMISRFDLLKVYDTTSMEKARKKLEVNTSVNVGKDGMVTVTVDDGDKARVAQLANGYVDELTKLTRVLAITEAAQRRLFFERQLEQAKEKLAAAEVALKKGLDTKGVVSVDADSRAMVETVARLRAQATAKEIQLNSMRAFVTENNQEYRQTQQELNSLRAELNRVETGRDDVASSVSSKTLGGLENIKTLREVKYQQMLYELLAKQYEAARLDEARDSSVIQTLDPAIVPEKQFSPKPLRMAVIAALLAFFGALTIAYGRDAIARALREHGSVDR